MSTLLACYVLVAVAVTVLLVVALHRLEPEFEPAWRMLSEYSLGRYGILMRLAFITGASAVGAAGVLLNPAAGWPALGLVVVAVGPLGAAFVDTDPITTPRAQLSTRSKVHAALGALFILGFPIAATVAGVAAAGTLTAGPLLAIASLLPWAGLVWFMTVTLRSPTPDGVGGPQARIGWPNRWSMIGYLTWVVLAALLTFG